MRISPSICINPIDTDKSDVKELVGTTFSVKTVEESEEREDSFYLYENEPLIEHRISKMLYFHLIVAYNETMR